MNKARGEFAHRQHYKKPFMSLFVRHRENFAFYFSAPVKYYVQVYQARAPLRGFFSAHGGLNDLKLGKQFNGFKRCLDFYRAVYKIPLERPDRPGNIEMRFLQNRDTRMRAQQADGFIHILRPFAHIGAKAYQNRFVCIRKFFYHLILLTRASASLMRGTSTVRANLT